MGKNPTHLDSHQHVHRHTAVLDALVKLSRRLGVPLRHHNLSIREFYGQTRGGAPRQRSRNRLGLRKILKRLPMCLSELCCHPGLANDVKSAYRIERTQEVKVLCDPGTREALFAEAIELRSFTDVDRLNIA